MSPVELEKTIDSLRTNLGPGLLSCDVWTAEDGFSIAGYHSLPKAVAFFNQVADQLISTLEGSEGDLPSIGEYFYVKLAEEKGVIVVLFDSYRISILFDQSKVQLGYMFNILLPNFLESLESVILN
jgi:Na+-transporting NADH:ubiquinone oxidoreductase subunit NqrB